MDAYDRKILTLLQTQGRLTNKELAEAVMLSPSPCWRRVQRLETSGIIQGYRAVLDQEKLGLTITAFAHVTLDNHHSDTVAAFDRAILQWPEVLECHATSGDSDYLLKIVTRDMPAYNRFLSEKLLTLPAIRAINSSFSLNCKKNTTDLPLAEGISTRN
jgi:DNA-binding Lrp family transcriptional regulator